jgi:hypothetical protein
VTKILLSLCLRVLLVISVYRLVIVGFLATLLLVLQVTLFMLPNVELVTLLLCIIALLYPLKDSLLIVFVFALLEGLIWGFADWVIGYMWIWSVWVIIVIAFKRICQNSAHRYAMLGALWGFLFGFLFAIQHAFLYGSSMGLAYYIRGISFDLIHAFANYVTILLLFNPCYKTLSILHQKLEKRYAGHD